jgi:multiple antibiotic resistance protein
MQFLREIIGRNVAFAVIDIIGSIPIIIDLRSKFGHLESGKASVTSGAIMIVLFVVRNS